MGSATALASTSLRRTCTKGRPLIRQPSRGPSPNSQRFRRSWLPCDGVLRVPVHVRCHVFLLFHNARLLAGATFRNTNCHCQLALDCWKGKGVTLLHSFTRAWSGALSGAVPRSARPGPHRFLCYSPASCWAGRCTECLAERPADSIAGPAWSYSACKQLECAERAHVLRTPDKK